MIESRLTRRRRAPRPEPSGAGALCPRSKVWLERGGEVVLSDWRVELLEAIEATGSLARAAERLEVPYRTAWYKLKELVPKAPSLSCPSLGSRCHPDLERRMDTNRVAPIDQVVTGGVDTHKDIHLAAAITATGCLLGTAEFPTTAKG